MRSALNRENRPISSYDEPNQPMFSRKRPAPVSWSREMRIDGARARTRLARYLCPDQHDEVQVVGVQFAAPVCRWRLAEGSRPR
jgi:hypothetical protein